MSFGLSLEALPVWEFSSFRYFEKHEKHVTRTYQWDVLIIVFEGVLRFNENGAPIELSAGEYYIQRNGLLQEGVRESESPKYFFIHWTGGEYTHGEDVLPLRGKVDFSELFPLFKEMELLRVTSASLVEISSVFYKILSALHKNANQKFSSDVVAKVIFDVTSDIRRPFSLDEIAKRYGYSKNHIIVIFKNQTGKTPHNFINDMKIDMAKQLLLNSESTLASISIECGFGNYINLYRNFMKSEGCSPADWKKKNRKDIYYKNQD